MKEIRCIITNSNDEVLICKENGFCKLPNVFIENFTDEKCVLKNTIKKWIKSPVKENFFVKRIDKENVSYYYCEELYNDAEFKKNIFLDNNFIWIATGELKNVLEKENNNSSKELINDLSICLGTSFKYTKKQRIKNQANYEKAKEKNYENAATYYCLRHMNLLLNEADPIDDLESLYKKKLITQLCFDLRKKYDNQKNEPLELPVDIDVFKLTYDEAIKNGKYNEWKKDFDDHIRLFNLLQISPDYIEKLIILYNKDDITPYILSVAYNIYKGKSPEYIKEDIDQKLVKINAK